MKKDDVLTSANGGVPQVHVRYPHPGVPPPIAFATWKKHVIMQNSLSKLNINERRELFAMLRREPEVTSHHFCTKHGCTLGDFCYNYHITNGRR